MKEQADRRLTLNRRGQFLLVLVIGHLAVNRVQISIIRRHRINKHLHCAENVVLALQMLIILVLILAGAVFFVYLQSIVTI